MDGHTGYMHIYSFIRHFYLKFLKFGLNIFSLYIHFLSLLSFHFRSQEIVIIKAFNVSLLH